MSSSGPGLYRDPALARQAVETLHRRLARHEGLRFMEFCGTHTHNMFHFGFRYAFRPHLRFIAGPGCPVCVTAEEELAEIMYLLQRHPDVGILVYGDMLRVPVQGTSLADMRGQGTKVEIVYSAFDAITVAQAHPERQWVFVGVGFETTAPATAAMVMMASKQGVTNLSILSFHKNTKAVLYAIADIGELHADAIILPGHVSAVVGWDYFAPVTTFGLPACVIGFEPLDILVGVGELLTMVENGEKGIRCAYPRAVNEKGNRTMMSRLDEVFEHRDTPWRGLGVVPGGGYELRPAFELFNARRRFGIPDCSGVIKKSPCRCGDVLVGSIEPDQCPLFKTVCVPENPIGPCMVSHEGTCLAYYKWSGLDA